MLKPPVGAPIGGTRVCAFLNGGFLNEALRGTKIEGMMHIAECARPRHACACAGLRGLALLLEREKIMERQVNFSSSD